MSNARHANGHRARQQRARVLASQDTCALCGQPVDKTLHYLNPWAPEVDHATPISHGGAMYSYTNAQLTHRICNQRKSNRIAVIVAGPLLTSRNW